MNTHKIIKNVGNEDFVGSDDKTYEGRQYVDERGVFHTEYWDTEKWQDTGDREEWTIVDRCRTLSISEKKYKMNEIQ